MILKSGPDQTTAGASITYTIDVSNVGPDTASSVTVTDPMPPGVTATTASGTGWSCGIAFNVVQCTQDGMAVGPASSITVSASVDGGVAPCTYLTNIATVSGPEDLTEENNSSTSTAWIPVPTVDVGVLMTAHEGVLAGGNLVYNLSVTSAGPYAAANVTLSDTLPGDLTFVSMSSAAGWSCTTPAVGSGGTVSCSAATLPAGTSNFTLIGHVPAGALEGDFYQNFASVSTTSTDINSENDSSVAGTYVRSKAALSALSLEIGFDAERFVSAGEAIGINYTVTNTAIIDVDTISVTDTKVPALSCPATSLPVGASLVCTGTYIVTDADVTAGSITFSATASGNGVSPLVTATASISSGAGVVSETFGTMTRGFVETRQKLIAAAIDPPGLHDRSRQPSASLAETEGGAVLNFAASTAGAWDRGPGAALDARGGSASPLNLWVDGSVGFHSREDAKGSFGTLGLGADYLFNEDFLAGVALYLDFMSDIGSLGEVSGNGALIGPYVSVGIAEGLTLDASLFYGRSWNDAEAELFGDTYTGAFETERLLGQVELEGEWLVDQLTVRPSARLFISNENVDGYTVSNGLDGSVAVDGFTSTLVQLSSGLSVEQTIALGDGLDLTPQFGIRGGLQGTGEFALDEGFAVFSTGLTFNGSGWSLGTTAELGFDTTGLATGGIRAELSGSF